VTSCLGGGPTPPLSASHAQHSAVSSRHVGLMPFPAAFMKAQSDSRAGAPTQLSSASPSS